MSVSHVKWESYAKLRDHPICNTGVREALQKAGVTHEPAGGWRLGHASSWGRWGFKDDLTGPINASTAEEFQSLKPMTTSIVLFAVNWGGTNIPADPGIWHNFHCPGHRGDSFLAKTVDTAMSACGLDAAPYMSDVFKLIPTPTSPKLKSTLRSEQRDGRDHVKRCASLLREELTICMTANGGVPPVVAALGGAAYGWLAGIDPMASPIRDVVCELLGSEGAIRQASHYTFGAGGNGVLFSDLKRVFEEAIAR